ncbi:MAG TPA: MSMEG_6728 family protein [Ktedonobacteraceae bacterium]
MQTFLPYPSFEETAAILDYRRLGKQRIEAFQIHNIITQPDYVGRWAHHPAVKMWRGYENALKLYVNVMIAEWVRRGYRNTMLYYPVDREADEILLPWWLGDPLFHDSHKSNLLRKFPAYYSQFHWDVPDDLPYVWPV